MVNDLFQRFGDENIFAKPWPHLKAQNPRVNMDRWMSQNIFDCGKDPRWKAEHLDGTQFTGR